MHCLNSDHDRAGSHLQNVTPYLELHQIKETLCMAKYSHSLIRPRPLLVKLSSISTTVNILSECSSLPACCNVSINSQLSLLEKWQHLSYSRNAGPSSMPTSAEVQSNYMAIQSMSVSSWLRTRLLDGFLVKGHTLNDLAALLHALSTLPNAPPCIHVHVIHLPPSSHASSKVSTPDLNLPNTEWPSPKTSHSC